MPHMETAARLPPGRRQRSVILDVRRRELFRPRQFANELGGIVDQHREMLGADLQGPTLEFEGEEGNLFGATAASQALIGIL